MPSKKFLFFFLSILCLDAFFQAQKGSILYCLAKVLSLFEVSSVPDVFGDFENDFFDANVVYLDFKIIIMIIQMVKIKFGLIMGLLCGQVLKPFLCNKYQKQPNANGLQQHASLESFPVALSSAKIFKW